MYRQLVFTCAFHGPLSEVTGFTHSLTEKVCSTNATMFGHGDNTLVSVLEHGGDHDGGLHWSRITNSQVNKWRLDVVLKDETT